MSIVDRDRTDAPAAGYYNVCYVNAFQTQPGESGLWPSSVILKNANGTPIQDPGWPGEYILDTRTALEGNVAPLLAMESLMVSLGEGILASS